MAEQLVVEPTHTCFDDVFDLLLRIGMEDWDSYSVVHALCRAPDGELFAHAWIEADAVGGEPPLVWQTGLVNGSRVRFAVEREEHYQLIKMSECIRYTTWQAVEQARRHAHGGPWAENYRAHCAQHADVKKRWVVG